MIGVLFLLAHFLGALAIASFLPAIAAQKAEHVSAFVFTGATGSFFAGVIILAFRGREQRLRRYQRYLLAFLLFALLPVFAALPVYLLYPDTGFLGSYFEAVSALTTTGLSVLGLPEQLPQSLILWRCLLQWFGGALTLLLVVLALAPSGAGGLPLADARIIEHGGRHEGTRLLETLRDLLPIYCMTTLICFGLLVLFGTPAFDALCLAFAALSTGGFIARSVDFAEYMNSGAILIVSLFMLIGASSILWQQMVRQQRKQALANREVRWMLIISGALSLVLAGSLYQAGGESFWRSLVDGIVTATSIVSTTGIEGRLGGFAQLPTILILVLLLVGGSSFSTAGGLKMFRSGAMGLQAYRELNRLVYPHGIRSARFGTQFYDMQIMKAIWSALIAFMLVLCLVYFVLTASGLKFEDALVLGMSAIANAGPVYPAISGISEDFVPAAELGSAAKGSVIMAMILGRLEIIAFFSLLLPSGWNR